MRIVISIIILIVRLPLDFCLLTFHLIKGCMWRWYSAFNDFFDLPHQSKWPFGCLTYKTESNHAGCIPGKKYRWGKVFHCLCPDYQRVQVDKICEHQCLLTLYDQHQCWQPSWVRMVLVGFILVIFWAIFGYGLLLVTRPSLPGAMQALLPATITGDQNDRKTSVKHRSNRADKTSQEKSLHALQHADELVGQGNFSEALLDYRNAVRFDPHNDQAYFRLALCLLKLNRQEQALDALADCLSVNPRHWPAMIESARHALKSGDIDSALKYANQALSTKDDEPEAYLIRGACFNRQGNSAAAIADVKKALTYPIKDPAIYVLAGAFFFRVGEVVTAAESYNLALKLAPHHVDALVGLANLYGYQGKFDQADLYLEQLLKDNPNQLQALAGKAELAAMAGDVTGAVEKFKRLITRDDARPIDHVRLAELLLQANQTQNSIEILENILKKHPQFSRARTSLAGIYLRLKWYDSAIIQAQEVLHREPDNRDARMLLGQAYLAVGNNSAAITALEAITSGAEKNLDRSMWLATAYVNTNRLDQAAAMYRQAAADFPALALPLIALARLQSQRHDVDGAVMALRAGLERAPDDAVAATTLALLLLDDPNRIDEALEIAARLVRRHPNHPVVLNAYGQVLYACADFEQAQQVFMASRFANSEIPETHFFLGKVLAIQEKWELARAALQHALSISDSFSGAVEARQLLAKIPMGIR